MVDRSLRKFFNENPYVISHWRRWWAATYTSNGEDPSSCESTLVYCNSFELTRNCWNSGKNSNSISKLPVNYYSRWTALVPRDLWNKFRSIPYKSTYSYRKLNCIPTSNLPLHLIYILFAYLHLIYLYT